MRLLAQRKGVEHRRNNNSPLLTSQRNSSTRQQHVHIICKVLATTHMINMYISDGGYVYYLVSPHGMRLYLSFFHRLIQISGLATLHPGALFSGGLADCFFWRIYKYDKPLNLWRKYKRQFMPRLHTAGFCFLNGILRVTYFWRNPASVEVGSLSHTIFQTCQVQQFFQEYERIKFFNQWLFLVPLIRGR